MHQNDHFYDFWKEEIYAVTLCENIFLAKVMKTIGLRYTRSILSNICKLTLVSWVWSLLDGCKKTTNIVGLEINLFLKTILLAHFELSLQTLYMKTLNSVQIEYTVLRFSRHLTLREDFRSTICKLQQLQFRTSKTFNVSMVKSFLCHNFSNCYYEL